MHVIARSRCASGALLALLVAIPCGADEARPAAQGGTLDAHTRSATPVMSSSAANEDGGAMGGFAAPGDFAFIVPRGICENGNPPIQVYEGSEPHTAEIVPDG